MPLLYGFLALVRGAFSVRFSDVEAVGRPVRLLPAGRRSASGATLVCLAACAFAWLSAVPPCAAAEVNPTSAGAPNQAKASLIRLSSPSLALAIDAATGQVHGFGDASGAFDQIVAAPAGVGLWQFTAVQGGAGEEINSLQAGPPRIESLAGAHPGLRLVWDRVALRSGRVDMRVEVTVQLGVPAPELSRWTIAIGKPAGVTLRDLRFPRVGGLRERPDECLAVPYSLGMMTRVPRTLLSGAGGKGARLHWESPHRLSLQCVTLYGRGGPGFLALCEDPLGRHKGFSFWGDAGRQVHFEAVHTPETDAAGLTEYRLPYTVVLGSYSGDWMTAAALYRATPAAREIASRGRLRNGLTAPWLAETGLWVWNRGRSADVLGPALALKQHLGLPVNVLWHWWHECPYDAGFPDYLPPREGAESFRTALAAAHRENLHVLLYMNQRLWGTTTDSWRAEGAAAHAVKRRNGTIETTIYQKRLAVPMATMCLGTPFWRAKYASLSEAVLCDLGADGVYMDQTGLPGDCHDPAHGHPLGVGVYWHQGLAMLTEDIRRRSAARGAATLGGEFVGEPWIGDLDLTLALDTSAERIGAASADWERIPFYPAVYHEAALAFGSYAGLVYPPYDEKWPQDERPARALTPLDARFDAQFCLEQSRCFAWGLQPMIANFQTAQLSERPTPIGFLSRLVRTRQRALPYLQRGVWLRPPDFVIPTLQIPLVQVSIYNPPRETARTYPAVIVGAWRAQDGAVGIALASLGDSPLELAAPVDFAAYGLPESCEVNRIDEQGRRALGRLRRESPTLRVTLAPRDVCVIELAPVASRP